ncbi:unnamed protein product [Penicillium olsonii]|uniref:L-dopachrome isomerase n=1 Tax=Penicillium olsonii TaxID=99116 RepID=A0A9W4MPG7_PENOL|nr:unnamed protein product [Penicillium olsonii]CAG8059440.1 unnamed protein product [Penicillium olsonii]
MCAFPVCLLYSGPLSDSPSLSFFSTEYKMDLKNKPSLPHLSTTFPLFEKPSNASSQSLVAREKPTGGLDLSDEERSNENIAPIASIARPDLKPAFVTRKGMEDSATAKVKKLYYDDIFATRGSHNSPKDRVTFESVVVVEFKTNTQGDTSKAISEFSHALTEIYQRPEASMLVTIDQSADLLFGATNGSAYLLKVSALASLIAPLTNVRNTGLIQSIIQDIFDISPEKGVIIFNPLSEDNLATNGITAREEIDRLERDDRSPSLFRSISRSMSRRPKSSSDNSAPLTLSSAVSPDAAHIVLRSPVASPSIDVSPLGLDSPDTSDLAGSAKPSSSREETYAGNTFKRSSTRDKKTRRSMRRRESLKSFVARRLEEMGVIPPLASPKSPVKENKD